MATFFIDDTGVVNTASTGADSIYIQSAAVKGSEILGLAGNDTINLLEGVATNNSAVGLNVKGGDGGDSISISALASFSAGQHTIIGGGGADTITMTGTTLDVLKGNAGNDSVLVSGGTFSAIGLSSGSDTITLADGAATAHIKQLSLGDGHDQIASSSTIEFNTAGSVIGGAGRDTIEFSVGAGSQTAFINGGALQDVIQLNGTLTNASTVKGMGGNDTITMSGDGATSAFITLGAGADKLTLSGLNDGATIGGGSGNDSIAILDGGEESAEIFGGSGNDSISFNAIATAETMLQTVAGGAGADTITFSAGAQTGTTTLGTLSYSSFSESDLTNTDKVSISVTPTSGALVKFTADFADDLTAVTISEAVGAVELNDATFSGNIAAGALTLSGTYDVSSITAIAGTVDTITLDRGKGGTVLITAKGGNNYLFVQGGTAGTSDDAIIDIGTLSGATLAAVGSTAISVTLSGVI